MQTLSIIDLDETIMEAFLYDNNQLEKIVMFSQNRHQKNYVLAHTIEAGRPLEQHIKFLPTNETDLNDYVNTMSNDGYTCSFLELDREYSDSAILSTKYLTV